MVFIMSVVIFIIYTITIIILSVIIIMLHALFIGAPVKLSAWFDRICPLTVDLFSLKSNRFLSAAVRAAAVEVNQNVARLRAFAGADDAAIFQFVHDARGAGVAEAQAALHERDARLLFAADDLDALLDNFLVLVNAAFVSEFSDGFGKLLVDFRLVGGLALLGDEVNDILQFLIGNQCALGTDQFPGAGRQIEHV